MNWLQRLFNQRTPGPEIVIVSGLPRSGTSMLMRMLETGGLPLLTDGLRTPDNDNPRGYYEYEPVKKLREGVTGWLDQAQGKAVKVISALLSYLPKDRRYRVLFILRALPEILASQRKMLINRGEDPDKINDIDMAKYFEGHLAQVTGWLKQQPHLQVLYVDYNSLLKDPAKQVHEINAFLGGGLDEDKMTAVIDPSLYRQRK
jgi:hypothetical protein